MENLKNHYEALVKKYREIFAMVLNTMQGEINSLKPEQLKHYLEVNVEDNIKRQRSLILEKRKEFSCNKCGACCKLAISEYSPSQLLDMATRGDNYAKEFISTFTPYENEKEAEEQFKLYVELIKESGENVYYYHCKKITSDNLCSNYENRPKICRDYPDNPIQMLHPTCSYIGWHEKIQTIVLTIRAMTEIKHHFLNELNKGKDIIFDENK